MATAGFSAAPDRDLQHALLFPKGAPWRSVGRPVFDLDFKHVSANHTFVNEDSNDPVTVSLKVGGATLANTTDLRMVGAGDGLELGWHCHSDLRRYGWHCRNEVP